MSMDFLFTQDIEIKLNVKVKGKDNVLSWIFEHPTDEDQFRIISGIDNINEFEEAVKNTDNLDKKTIDESLSIRKIIKEIMIEKLLKAPGYETNAEEYIDKLNPKIRNKLIEEFMNKSMEGLTEDSGEEYIVSSLDIGSTLS